MAGRNEGCASIGCLGFVLLALAGMCDGSDGGSRSTYTPSYTPASVTASSYQSPEPQEWFYVHGTMNVRAEPDPDARVVRTLSRGDRVQLGPKNANGWARVYGGGSTDEYVFRASELVRTTSPAAPEPLSSRGSGSSGGRSRRSAPGGRELHVGPRGGCYYYNSSGNKQYVDRSECN